VFPKGVETTPPHQRVPGRNVPVRIRKTIVQIPIEQTSIRTIVQIAERQHKFSFTHKPHIDKLPTAFAVSKKVTSFLHFLSVRNWLHVLSKETYGFS